MTTFRSKEVMVQLISPSPAAINPMVPKIYRVKRTHKETHDTFTLDLEPAQDKEAYIPHSAPYSLKNRSARVNST